MGRRLQAAVRNAILYPVYMAAALAATGLVVGLLALLIHAVFPLTIWEALWAGMGVFAVVFLAALGALAGWREPDG